MVDQTDTVDRLFHQELKHTWHLVIFTPILVIGNRIRSEKYWKDSEEKFFFWVTSSALLFKQLPTRIYHTFSRRYQTFSRIYRLHIAFYQTLGFIFTVKITVKIVHFLPLQKYTKFWYVVIFTAILVPGYWKDSE